MPKTKKNDVKVESDGNKYRVRWVEPATKKKRSKSFMTREEAERYAQRIGGGGPPNLDSTLMLLADDAENLANELSDLYEGLEKSLSKNDWNETLIEASKMIVTLGRRGIIMPAIVTDKISTIARSAAPHISFQKHDKAIRELEEKINEILSARGQRTLKVVK